MAEPAETLVENELGMLGGLRLPARLWACMKSVALQAVDVSLLLEVA